MRDDLNKRLAAIEQIVGSRQKKILRVKIVADKNQYLDGTTESNIKELSQPEEVMTIEY